MAKKTETRNHEIHRRDVPHHVRRDSHPETQIKDKETGDWGKGIGNTQKQADQNAWDDLRSKKESS